MADTSTSLNAIVIGETLSSVPAFLQCQVEVSSIEVYLDGEITVDWIRTPAYLMGGGSSSDNTSAYLTGSVLVNDSQSAYIGSLTGSVDKHVYAYCNGIDRDSINAYLEGDPMTQVDYIWLKTSDNGATLSKKFKVLLENYDDGTLEKAEDVKKTIGGGLDHSVGGVYLTWSMVIRVRDTETEEDFGDKGDLEYLWGLNNPNGTPSNDIIFIDHHQAQYTVHTVGKLTKNILGCQIIGEDAWYLYKLNLIRVQ